MARDYEQDVFRLLYKNMDYNGNFFKASSPSPITTLVKLAVPLIMGLVTLCAVGFVMLVKGLAKGLDKHLENRRKAQELKKQDEIARKQLEIEQAKANQILEERLLKEQERQAKEKERKQTSQEIRDKAVVQLRKLVEQNFHQIQFTVLSTKNSEVFGKDKHGKPMLCTWVNFTVYDYDKKEVVCVNDLICTVCYDRIKVSTKDGKYLEGSLIFPYTDYTELEDKLRTLLQTCVTLSIA